MPRPTEHTNRRELLKLRVRPINRLARWAMMAGDVAAYRHYVDCFHREYSAYSNGLGLYACGR
jgi:hypothetical protein